MKNQRRTAIKHIVASVAGIILAKDSFGLAPDITYQRLDLQPTDHPLIVNAGVGGDNSGDLLQRIDKDCLSNSPKLTILMVGTNDMNSAKHVPLPQYERNLNQLVQKLKNSGSKVLVMTILPAYQPYLLTRHKAEFYEPEGVEMRRQQVNEVITKVSKHQKVHLLDIGRRFSAVGKIGLDQDSLIRNVANSNMTDGIHPTPNGYRFIGLSVYDYIIYHKLPMTDIVCFGDSITKGDGSMDKESYPAYLQKLLTKTTD